MSMYAAADLGRAFSNLRGWSYLASKQIQLEHRRTWIGSAWVIVTFALTSVGIGVLMSQLQGRPYVDHVPYVVFGFAAWNFISSTVTAGANVMVNAKPYLLQMPTPRSVFVLSLVLRNLYLLGLQVATAALVALGLGWRPEMSALVAIPAIMLYAYTAFWAALSLGLICARFRDLTRLIEAVMRLSFFFTPIIWRADSARGEAGGFMGLLVDWNPFSYVLRVLRDPLLGDGVAANDWIVLAALAALATAVGFAMLNAFGKRVTYWL